MPDPRPQNPGLRAARQTCCAVRAEYQVHYNTARPHQGIAQRVPDGTHDGGHLTIADLDRGRILRKPVLGGLINEYARAASYPENRRSRRGSYFRAAHPAPYPRKELIKRLRRRECELCETGATVAVHQVTGLKELGGPEPGQPAWAALMARMRRKTLIVCAPCHDWIHANPVAHAA
jgi:hypothetical protein